MGQTAHFVECSGQNVHFLGGESRLVDLDLTLASGQAFGAV
jgi:hypothetical protein